MKKLGVIGGMGPLATAIFMQMVVEMTEAVRDCEHIEMDILNLPNIPDRTDFILGKSTQSPVAAIRGLRQKLEERGADIIAMPCNTAFYFVDDIMEGSGIPIIHAIAETGKCLKEAGVKKVGILATDGTLATGLFAEGLAEFEIETIVPDDANQRLVMSMIYDDVKAGKLIEEEKLRMVETHLKDKGAEILILGCTELTLAKRAGLAGTGYLDTLEVMARKAVMECAVLKKEYEKLF